MHATWTLRVCIHVQAVRFVRVAFSYSPGGHLPSEAKSRFGRAWLSIMYNRNTSASRWDCCLPSICLAFRPAECYRLCSPWRDVLRLSCWARIRQPTVLLCTSLVPLPFMLSLLVDRDGYMSPTETWSKRELYSLPLNPKAFHFPFLLLAMRSDSFFSETTRKDVGAFSTLFLFVRRTLSYQFLRFSWNF